MTRHAALLLLGLAALWLWPVDVLVVRTGEAGIAREELMPLGRVFATRYLHSVQLSPVEDVYVVRDGLVRQWRGKVQSQNAGLPTVLPERTRFYLEGPWLVFEGRLPALGELVLRVGDAVLGRNCLRIGGGEWEALYEAFAGRRLYFSAERRVFGTARLTRRKL
ncbi:MAG: DUF1850 domain-containing protein [Desulfovibrio sp.]|jgi:hypothetical protein|nr:DUF1850 domain-containing protein [Desulfovibrio sp.]